MSEPAAPAAPASAPAATPNNFWNHLATVEAESSAETPAPADVPAPAQPVGDPPPDSEPALDPDEPAYESIIDEAAELEQLRQYKAQIESGEWTEELLNKTRKVKVGGLEYDITVNEAFGGYMRNADYSRKLREVTQLRTEATQMREGAQVLLQNMRDPQQLLAASKQLGFYPALFAAAKQIATERFRLSQLNPEARQYAMQLEQERDRAAEAERVRERLERQLQERQQEQPNEQQMRIKHQLEQLVPRAFAKHKIGNYPFAQQLFQTNLESLYQGGELTAELVDAAAQATAENLADVAARLPQGRPANTNGTAQPLPARKAAPANGKTVGRPAGGSHSDFRAHLDRLGR